MDPLSRRSVLAAAAAGTVATAAAANEATFGNPDEPPQGKINTTNNPSSFTDPGPQNPALSSQFPGAFSPPATDAGDVPMFWASFNNAPRRIQDGGWARQVTQSDFQIAEDIAGTNMRLIRGGIRELHWHQAAEWAYVSRGTVRVTTVDTAGRASVEDISEGGLWYFASGIPHSLQGIGEDGAEFILAFDNGHQTEYSTLLLSEWLAHTPPEILAQNFNVPAETFSKIPLHQLYIFPGQMPGPLPEDPPGSAAKIPNPSTFALAGIPPTLKTAGGEVRIADSRNFKASVTVAAALVTLRPGGLREMHWHPNADEWQYWISGQGEMTVFNTGPRAVTQTFKPGDIGYVKKSLGHYIKNTGGIDLNFLEIFRSDHYEDISLSDWLAHTPHALVAQHLNVAPSVVAQFPSNKPEILPE
jgi:oxalate decarboxylase